MGTARTSITLLASTATAFVICLIAAAPAAAITGHQLGLSVSTGSGSISVGGNLSVMPLPGRQVIPDCGGCYEWT